MKGTYQKNIFYVTLISGLTALIYWMVLLGSKLEEGRDIKVPKSGKSQWQEFLDALVQNFEHPLATLLAQIITIIVVARIFGWICNKIGQPTVIGEIIAGIVLGPSLVGWYFPEFSATLFPASSLGNLKFLSQIGLILFMFIIGMELDLKILKNKAQDAVIISHASIVIPFSLGVGFAYFTYRTFAPPDIPFSSFGLFMGIAMSITAFPVLARIVQEKGLHKTPLGTIAITCAAADDITAWCLLAAVIAIVKAGSFVSALYIIVLAVLYVLVMIKVIRPFLKRVGELHSTRENLSKPIVAIFFLILILSAYATEVIGIHALFGAFMAGAIMPENARFRSIFIEKVEDLALVLLLPLFFVFTGLRTEIGLLNDPYLWKITGLIILVAVAGKFVGSALAAKFVGQNLKDSLTIGVLMNTRGLMELVVLNIGYDLGILTPEIFAMMVIMALVTTFMTGPSLDLINWAFKTNDAGNKDKTEEKGKFKILISFGNPERGRSLLKLATHFTKKIKDDTSITAMHLISSEELNQFNTAEYEEESFTPIIQESKSLNQKITTLYKATNDIEGEIAEVANKGTYDLLLIGVGQSIFEGSLLGKILGFTTKIINPEKLIGHITGKESLFENLPFDDRIRIILEKTEAAVGILADKGFDKADRVFIPIFGEMDHAVLFYAEKLIRHSGSTITFMDAEGCLNTKTEIAQRIRNMLKNTPDHLATIPAEMIEKEFLQQMDLMMVSVHSWKKLIETKSNWLSDMPSTLIISNANQATGQ